MEIIEKPFGIEDDWSSETRAAAVPYRWEIRSPPYDPNPQSFNPADHTEAQLVALGLSQHPRFKILLFGTVPCPSPATCRREYCICGYDIRMARKIVVSQKVERQSEIATVAVDADVDVSGSRGDAAQRLDCSED